MGVEIPLASAAALVAVIDELLAQRQNITAVDDLDTALERHVADSLAGAAQPEIRDATGIVDVGSGSGFPGLALAVALPGLEVTLVESERRKAEWLESVSVRFPNVRVVRARSEDLAKRRPAAWPVAIARALAPPPSALELCAPLVARGGHVVLWCGPRDAEMDARATRAAAELGLAPADVRPVAPFPGARRHLHVHEKPHDTPPRYPRRPGRASKRPIA